MYTSPSSAVHIGPRVPLEDPSTDASATAVDTLVNLKTCLFLSSVSIQLLFYVGVLMGRVKMPDDDEDDVGVVASRNELLSLLGVSSNSDGLNAAARAHDAGRGRSHSVQSERERGSSPSHCGDLDADDDDDLESVGQSLHGEALGQLSGFVHGVSESLDQSRHSAMQLFSSPSSSAAVHRDSDDDYEQGERGGVAPPSPSSSSRRMRQRQRRASHDTDKAASSPTYLSSAAPPLITLVFVENMYIVFWISKDFFWSWGTGDFTKGLTSAIFYESFAIFFGMVSFCVLSVTAYLYRGNVVRLVDAVTTLCWVAANFVWMSGELFLRYANLQLDDSDQGNDGATRAAASCLFSIGILLQLAMVAFVLSRGLRLSHWRWRYRRYKRGEDLVRLRQRQQEEEFAEEEEGEEGERHPGDGNGHSLQTHGTHGARVLSLQLPPLQGSQIGFTSTVSAPSPHQQQ